jgi:hypothetical protein
MFAPLLFASSFTIAFLVLLFSHSKSIVVAMILFLSVSWILNCFICRFYLKINIKKSIIRGFSISIIFLIIFLAARMFFGRY